MASVEVVQATPVPDHQTSARSTQASEEIMKPAPAAVITVHDVPIEEEPKVLDVDEQVLQVAESVVVDQTESAENDSSTAITAIEELILQPQAQEVVAVPTQEIPPEADEETEPVLVIEEKPKTPVQVEESKPVDQSSPSPVEKTTEVEEEAATDQEKPAVAEVIIAEETEEAAIAETATTEEEANEAESSVEEVPAPKVVEDQSATVHVEVVQETAEEIKAE